MGTLRSVVPDNLRMTLALRRVQQTELADALGVSQQAVSLKLKGERPFTDGEIAAAARFLEVDPGELFRAVPQRSREKASA